MGRTRYVEQRFHYDCAVACLAMASSESYESVMANLCENAKATLEAQKGLYYAHDIFFLEDLGFKVEWEALDAGYKPVDVRTILTVPSKNHEGKLHAVYWDGEELHDPSKNIKYEKDEALEKATFAIKVSFK